ncbi:hypothetical protein [Enhygromyxa salina]|uniref:hypothetical protein n=1 Tax=Enhygromyxa salina TaxID=215803 RepID=UPI0011BAA7E3|nr:hypothetical protein [Enhygromyxa salina]
MLGVVEEIGARVPRIRDEPGVVHFIPNGEDENMSELLRAQLLAALLPLGVVVVVLVPNQALRARLGSTMSSRGLSKSPLASAAEPPSLTPNARLSARTSPKSFIFSNSALDLGLVARATERCSLARRR